MAGIPPEIITQILYRLPVKSVGRFRCVSKEWLSLSFDPKFIKTHLKTLNQNHIIFCDWCSLYSHPFHEEKALLTPTKFHLETDVNYSSFRFAFCNSCDGLVLVYREYNYCGDGFLVYNPTTRDYVELPLSGSYQAICREHNVCSEDTMKGIGYDSMTDDYKVVTISYFRRFITDAWNGVFVHVYSLRTNTWKLLTDYAYDYSFVDYSYHDFFYDEIDSSYGYSCVFVNEFLHWIAEKNSNGLHVIIAFSLADEIFSELPSPNLCNDDVDFMPNEGCRLFALGGKLAIFVEGVVWLMNEYGKTESWTKILLYRLDEIQMDHPKVFDDNGRVLVADNHRMLLYDVEKRSFGSTVYVCNLKKFRVDGTCVESLVSPKFSQGQQRAKSADLGDEIRQV